MSSKSIFFGIVAIVFFIVAAACGFQFGAEVIERLRLPGSNFDGPGERMVEVPEAGMYTLWLDSTITVDGVLRRTGGTLPDGAEISARMADGTQIEVRHSGNETVSINGDTRVAIAKLEIPAAGELLIATSGFDEPLGFRLDQFDFMKEFLSMMGWAAGAGAAALVAVLCVILAIFSRSRPTVPPPLRG